LIRKTKADFFNFEISNNTISVYMLSKDFRARQVHLDFHTSEAIPGLGSKFDGEAFARTLVDAKVNSITCFARCHHG
jgi:hypothetical protein